MKNIANFFLQIILLSITYLVLPADAVAQSEKKADAALSKMEFRKSYEMYRKLAGEEDAEPEIWYKLAEVARELKDYATAEKYYTKILENGKTVHFAMSTFGLALVKKSLGKYEEAIELYNIFVYEPKFSGFKEMALQEIQSCIWAMSYPTETNDQTLRIDRLDENINSNYSETAAVEMGNHLFYSTARYKYSDDKLEPKRQMTRMMVSKNLERGKTVSLYPVEDGIHLCHTAFSADWQRMYFNRCEYIGDSEELICQIYYVDQDKNGRWNKEAIRLPDHINLPGYTATHPAIGFDSLTQQEVLFFVSDRPGGAGQLDIWQSVVKGNSFAPPVNLTELNTFSDDVTPSFHTPTQTLFFSSKSNTGFGGFDIFSNQLINGQWAGVENLGSPLNSSFDDLFFSKNTLGNRAYFSSNRPGTLHPRGTFAGCCFDIFRVYYADEKGHSEKSKNQ